MRLVSVGDHPELEPILAEGERLRRPVAILLCSVEEARELGGKIYEELQLEGKPRTFCASADCDGDPWLCEAHAQEAMEDAARDAKRKLENERAERHRLADTYQGIIGAAELLLEAIASERLVPQSVRSTRESDAAKLTDAAAKRLRNALP